MIVTFISQCEKKSLNKTRRVLDAFANRIGNKTWQTAITSEGLLAVKTLLRKTATKNTAVSCHKIKTRRLTELVWIVGNKDKFNFEGHVPVNYTNQEDVLKMDEIEINIKKYYANTKKQPLDQHLFAVGYVAQQIIKHFINDKKLAQVAFVSGCLHDIGKIDPEFQNWIIEKTKKKLVDEIPDEGQHIDKKSGKFSWEKHPRHNEISLLFYHLLNNEDYKNINKSNKDRIRHTIYWHHAKPIRKDEVLKLDTIYKKLKNNIGNANFKTMLTVFIQTIEGVNKISKNYSEEFALKIDGLHSKFDEDTIYELKKEYLPEYKEYPEPTDYIEEYKTSVKENAKNNLVRTALVTADRLISSLNCEALTNHIEESTLDSIFVNHIIKTRGLKQHIQKCLDGFETRFPNSERNILQAEKAIELSEDEESESGVKVLSGAAGCGKTKIALEWALNTNAKKILWICPRVQVCLGLIKDLTNVEYLPNAKIEVNTGEFKSFYQFGKEPIDTPEGEEFSGDIVITTIDQVMNSIITHKSVTTLVEYMDSHVVFDEFHEYITMPAFNLLFSELVQCKTLQKERAKLILVSATPNYYFVNKFLKINEENIIDVESFNQSLYQIKQQPFDEDKNDASNPLYQTQPKNTFVISNTAITAQQSFIKNQDNENAILIHSKYKKSDKELIFDNVFESFKRDGNKKYDVLRAGPIVQASLNISSDKMITEFTNAENWLQRLGRLDRFGENKEANIYITAIPQTIIENGKQTGGCARFLNRLHSFNSAKAWSHFVSENLLSKPIQLSEIYKGYKDFYEQAKNHELLKQDFIASLKQSVKVIHSKLIDPISFPNRKKPKSTKVKIAKSSLRGDNRFVQMAQCKITLQGKLNFTNNYTYDVAEDANLTLSTELIRGYDDSKQDLLGFMVKKHHNIIGGKKSYKDTFTLNEARNPETPIYVSYTLDDLKKVESKSHEYAIYYTIGNKQPIGAISLNKLTKIGKIK